MAQDLDIMVRRTVTDALLRLVRQEEYAAELDRLKLRDADALRHFLDDPAAQAGVRHALEEVIEAQAELDRHRDSPPSWWPPTWQPTTDERRHLAAMVGAPVVWLVLAATLAPDWPVLVQVAGWLVMIMVVAIGAVFGLPVELWDRVQWAARGIWMAAQVPSRESRHRWRLREEVLVPELRAWLNRQQTPSFELELHLRDAEDLTLPAGEGPPCGGIASRTWQACFSGARRGFWCSSAWPDWPGAGGAAGTSWAGSASSSHAS